jgi:hypothetical protein
MRGYCYCAFPLPPSPPSFACCSLSTFWMGGGYSVLPTRHLFKFYHRHHIRLYAFILHIDSPFTHSRLSAAVAVVSPISALLSSTHIIYHHLSNNIDIEYHHNNREEEREEENSSRVLSQPHPVYHLSLCLLAFASSPTRPDFPTDSSPLHTTTLNADDMTNDSNYKSVRYIHLTMDPVPAEESAVDNFAVCLPTLLGYVPRTRMTRTRADISLTIC